jgi:hypothetical protein
MIDPLTQDDIKTIMKICKKLNIPLPSKLEALGKVDNFVWMKYTDSEKSIINLFYDLNEKTIMGEIRNQNLNLKDASDIINVVSKKRL